MSIFGKAFNKITGGSGELQPSEKLPAKSPKTPDKTNTVRPESAKTADSSQGRTTKNAALAKGDSTVKGKNEDFQRMIEEDARLANEVAEEIGLKILNSRKVNVKDEDAPGSKSISKNTLKNQMGFEIKNKDLNGRSIVHRAAFEQQHSQMNEVITALKNLPPEQMQKEIELPDKYGNTALMLACVRYYKEDIDKQNNQKSVVKDLLTEGYANSNIQNPQTFFTPLHWAAVHGAEMIVKTLLENGAKPYTPDKRGLFPIDYAGLFKMDVVVKMLIDNQIKLIEQVRSKMERHMLRARDKLIERNEEMDNIEERNELNIFWTTFSNSEEELHSTSTLFQYADKNLIISSIKGAKNKVNNALSGGKANNQAATKEQIQLFQATGGANPILQFSPVYHTSLLYWAAKSTLISDVQMESVMKKLEAYPEGPVSAENWRTPCHAAAEMGDFKKLKILMSEVNKRYTNVRGGANKPAEGDDEFGDFDEASIAPEDRFKKPNPCGNFEDRQALLIKTKNYRKYRLFNTSVFQSKLSQYRTQAEEQMSSTKDNSLKFDFLDRNYNSPLHIASQNGHTDCIEMLLVEYRLQFDLRNIDGWMAKDLVQYEVVQKSYRNHYTRITNQIKKIAGDIYKNKQIKQAALLQNSRSAQLTQSIVLKEQQAQKQLFDQESMDEALREFPERDRLNRELLLCRDFMPFVPPLVLKVNLPIALKDQSNTEIINDMIDLLITSKFNVQMFPSLNINVYFIALKMDPKELENEAKYIEIKIKLVGIDSKRVYDPNQKGMFEPFRSKDIQQIMLSKLSRLVNMPLLKKKDIILSVIPMHDFFGIHEIKSRWWRNSIIESPTLQKKGFFSGLKVPQPLPMITQLYKESISFQFSELSTIKNYFGEKVGFYYAYMSYYTAWLMIPAGVGLALTIYQFQGNNVDTIFSSLYALMVCIWVTIFIERWKRKSAEICLKWGVSDILLQNSGETRMMRDEFFGYEYFSHITYSTEKKNFQGKRAAFYIVISLVVQIILIGATIGAFFGNLELRKTVSANPTIEKFKSTIIGVINGVVIAVIDFLYSTIATYFVNIENHKYHDSYEKSYVYKIFIFKFINTNLSLFYTAFSEQDFNQLYYLILGMAITKSVQIFLLKNFKRLAIFWLKQKLYFRNVMAAALRRNNQHQSYMNDLQEKQQTRAQNGQGKGPAGDQQQVGIEKMRQEAMSQMGVFKKLDHVNFPLLQRMVFNGSTNVDKQQILIDYVELNDIMPPTPELVVINEISEVFILFGLATLYSCACPIVPLVTMIHNLIDINFSLFVNYTTARRPVAQLATNIHPWLSIAEFMAYAAVISNCLLLYFSTPVLRKWIEERLDDAYQEVYILWILVGVEHGIVIIKTLCSSLIEDVPGWVEKSQRRVEREDKNLAIQQSDREKKQMIMFIKDKIEEQTKRRKQTMEEIGKMIQKAEVQKIDNIRIQDALVSQIAEVKEQKEAAEFKVKDVELKFNRLKEQSQGKKDPNSIGLVDFLGVEPNEWMGKSRIVELERVLLSNIVRRLMHQTLVQSEKDIVSKKLGQIIDIQTKALQLNYSGEYPIVVLCAYCAETFALFHCEQCGDALCVSCEKRLHTDMSHINQKHTALAINTQVGSIQPGKSRWRKFEQFNFPLMTDNDLYNQMQIIFFDMKQKYLDRNYIESTAESALTTPGVDKLNLQGFFIDRQYNILLQHQGEAMQKRDRRLLGEDLSITAKTEAYHARDSFNQEELFYMNRLAYYLFVIKGSRATYQEFVEYLSKFQFGTFHERATIFLKLLCEENHSAPGRSFKPPNNIDAVKQGRKSIKMEGHFEAGKQDNDEYESYITRSQLEETFRFLFIQRRPIESQFTHDKIPKNYMDIIEEIFKLHDEKQQANESTSYKQLGVADHDLAMKFTDVLAIIKKQDEVKDFMHCVLQCDKLPPLSLQKLQEQAAKTAEQDKSRGLIENSLGLGVKKFMTTDAKKAGPMQQNYIEK